MPLSWNEIRNRSFAFAKEWQGESRDFKRAHQQDREYFSGLKDYELPRYILVSDFKRFI
jgi:hypothetical protein